MLYKLNFKLDDQSELVAIVDKVSSEKDALNKAIVISKRCFPAKSKYQLSKDNTYRAERFRVDGEQGTAKGNYSCRILAHYISGKQDSRELFKIKGSRTAYAAITKDNKVKPDVVFIYSLSQKEVKEIGNKKAKKILGDEQEAKKVLRKFEEAVAHIPGIGGIIQDFFVFGFMVWDYVTGKYREVPAFSIIAIATAVVYIAAPDLIPGGLDDIAVFNVTYKACRKDIETYKQWRDGKKPKQIAG